jgi:alpha-beta hydrolase superfamily lysophospholipase
MLDPAPSIEFFQAKDGYRMASRVWHSDSPLAQVVYLHGIVSHGGWYLPSCAHLARNGFCVHFLERRGSGLNAEARGDVDDWPTWIDDVAGYVGRLPAENPRILLGISWGGTLAAAVARRHPDLVDGLGLLCPGLFSRKAPSPFKRGAIRLLHALGLRQLRVPIPLQDPELFTNSKEAQAYIASDPLTLWKITISFAAANLDLVRFATERPEDIRSSTLLLLAGKDPITQNADVRSFVDRIGHAERRVIEYPGASHTLEFEPDPIQYFEDLTTWCRSISQRTVAR